MDPKPQIVTPEQLRAHRIDNEVEFFALAAELQGSILMVEQSARLDRSLSLATFRAMWAELTDAPIVTPFVAVIGDLDVDGDVLLDYGTNSAVSGERDNKGVNLFVSGDLRCRNLFIGGQQMLLVGGGVTVANLAHYFGNGPDNEVFGGFDAALVYDPHYTPVHCDYASGVEIVRSRDALPAAIGAVEPAGDVSDLLRIYAWAQTCRECSAEHLELVTEKVDAPQLACAGCGGMFVLLT